jgi:hypothetical protein
MGCVCVCVRVVCVCWWLYNGSEHGKGQLQLFIDKLPAITNTILQDGGLTLDDQIIIQEALFAGADIKIMSKNWPKRLVLLQENLTAAQVNQAISNKLAVEALNIQVIQLLLQLQKAFENKGYNWRTQKKNIIRIVNQHFTEIDDEEKRSVGHLPDVGEDPWPVFGDDSRLAHMSGMLSRLNNLSNS